MITEKNKKTIVIVLEATLGGTRKYCFDYLSRIDLSMFRVIFVYSRHRADKQFYEDLAILKNRGVEVKEIHMVREINPIVDFVSFLKLIIFLRSIKYSIIHLHSSKAGFLGRIASKIVRPSAKTLYQPHMISVMVKSWYIYLERFAGYFTDIIIADSRSELEFIQGMAIVPLKKLYVINAGVDILSEKEIDSIQVHSSVLDAKKNNTVIIGAIARMSYPKDPFTVIKAMDVLRSKNYPCKCYWIGDGDYLVQCREIVTSLKLEDYMEFVGWQTNTIEWLSGIDIFLHSSKYESFGYVIAEAMSLGKPVVASKVTGVQDIIENGKTGLLFNYGDESGLASELEHYLSSDELRFSHGLQGKIRIEKYFTVGTMSDNISQLYKTIS